MRKEVKPAKLCDKCGSRLKPAVEAYFCDYCQQKFTPNRSKSLVEVHTFWKNESGTNADQQEFCSMKCARQWLIEFPYNRERVEFITLPYIHDFDDLNEFLGVKEGTKQ